MPKAIALPPFIRTKNYLTLRNVRIQKAVLATTLHCVKLHTLGK